MHREREKERECEGGLELEGGRGVQITYNLQEVIGCEAIQLEVQLLHNDELHSLNISLGELTAVTLHQHCQQRLHSLEIEKKFTGSIHNNVKMFSDMVMS